ncbi:MAG: hypothetical protein GEEBNDBF_01358 [bacterium]|nr:hypothetical protein [bacterium]
MSGLPAAQRRGFSLIESVAVAAIIVIIAGLGMTVLPAMKQAQIQSRAVTRLKQIATWQENYRSSGDLGVNPNGTFASYVDLQNAGFIARDLVPDDTTGHGGSPFLRYYRLQIGRDIANMTVPPDGFNYAVVAEPVGAPGRLPILYMEEDGQVFTINPDGTQRRIR